MIIKVVTLLGLAACALADGHHAISEQKVIRHYGELEHIGSKAPEHHEEYAWAYPSYEFSYFVNDPHTHDNKGQKEERHGDEVKGEYWLIEPDGRKRTVKYTSDKHNGFHAVVEYSAPHHHDEHEPEANPEVEHHHHHEHKQEFEIIHEHKHHEHEHKPVHEHKEHKPSVEEHKPIFEEQKEAEHIPLSVYVPRVHKVELKHEPRVHRYQENYYHPRNYWRHH